MGFTVYNVRIVFKDGKKSSFCQSGANEEAVRKWVEDVMIKGIADNVAEIIITERKENTYLFNDARGNTLKKAFPSLESAKRFAYVFGLCFMGRV